MYQVSEHCCYEIRNPAKMEDMSQETGLFEVIEAHNKEEKELLESIYTLTKKIFRAKNCNINYTKT